MTSITDLLQTYSGATPDNPPATASDDFGQVSRTAPRGYVADGLNHAFRSDQTPPFENMVANLFGASNGDQKAGILNQLLGSIGPGVVSGGILGSLAKYFGSGQSSTTITPQQAEEISPEAVQELAKNAQQQDPSIVDRASSFYAQHPTLVQALGAGALAMIMSHMSNRR